MSETQSEQNRPDDQADQDDMTDPENYGSLTVEDPDGPEDDSGDSSRDGSGDS